MTFAGARGLPAESGRADGPGGGTRGGGEAAGAAADVRRRAPGARAQGGRETARGKREAAGAELLYMYLCLRALVRVCVLKRGRIRSVRKKYSWPAREVGNTGLFDP